MGVQVHGAVQGILQGTHQHLGGIGLQEAGHILDGDGVGTTVSQLLCHLHIVVQGVLVPLGVADVAGIADGGLHQLVALGGLVHGNLHAGNPVQGVKDAEHVDSPCGRLLHKAADHIVGIVGVAHAVGTTEQHLEGDVGDVPPQPVQPLPGTFVQEAVGHVEGGTTPHLQGKALVHDLGKCLAALHHVTGTDTGCQQGLVGITHGGVHNQKLLLLVDPLCHRIGALFVQHLLEAGGWGSILQGHEAGGVVHLGTGSGIVYHNVSNVLQNLVGTVLGHVQLEELRCLVNELGVAATPQEDLVLENLSQEGDVCLHTTDPHLREGTLCLADHALKGGVVGGDFHQQAVVVGRDDRTAVDVASVKTDAVSAGTAVGCHLSSVRGKVVLRVLGGDTALEGEATGGDILLLRDADDGMAELFPHGHQNLGANQVDAGGNLGDGVLHLDAGVHLDEIVIVVLVHQELHRSHADVAHFLGQLHGLVPQLLQGCLWNGEGRGEFHHLLIAALEGAVTLVEVDDVAVAVRQNLHLDVLWLHQELLHEDGGIAEGLAGLLCHQLEGLAHLLVVGAGAHSPPAAAGCRLEDDGIAVAVGPLNRILCVLQRLRAAGNGGHIAAVGQLLGAELVAHLSQDG